MSLITFVCVHAPTVLLSITTNNLYSHHRYTFVFDNIPSATSSIAQPPLRSECTSIHEFVAPQLCLQFAVEGWSSLQTWHGLFFLLLLMLMVIFIFSLPSFLFIVLHCHTTGGPILGLQSASLVNVPPWQLSGPSRSVLDIVLSPLGTKADIN